MENEIFLVGGTFLCMKYFQCLTTLNKKEKTKKEEIPSFIFPVGHVVKMKTDE